MAIYFLSSLLLPVASLASDSQSNNKRIARSMLEFDPCLDYQLDSLQRLKFPPKFARLTLPWRDLEETPKIYESRGLQYQWTWLKSLNVRGVSPPQTLDDVIRFLESVNCFFLPFGEVVRSSILRQHPKQTTGEVSCSIQKLYNSCMKKYGKSSCGLYPIRHFNGSNAYRLEIGDATYNSSIDEIRSEPLHFYPWGYSLGRKLEDMGYSVDALSIFDRGVGQIYLVDVTGHGLTDVCERKIEATVASSDQWKQWGDSDLDKLLEFYYLRWKGFSVGNSALQPFVNDNIEKNFDKKTIQTFYCERILKGIIGWAGEDSTTTCHIVFPDNYERHAIAEAKEILTNELGTSWSKKINSMIDEIEAIYVTNSQFVQVRNKYANRTNEANPASKNTTTRYIGAGPMIQDIGDVHRRPIMWKSEAPTELPSDFPSVSNAKPDAGSDKFEFRSQQSPDISVYENPIAYEQDDWQGGASSEDRTRKRGTGIGTQNNGHQENTPYTSSSYSIMSCSSLIFSFLSVAFVNIWCL